MWQEHNLIFPRPTASELSCCCFQVDRYLSASGFLGETARPFFVALPKGERGTHAMATETAEEFRHKIAATDKQVKSTSPYGDAVIRLDQENAVIEAFHQTAD
jgi:hypothetical protein